MEVNIIYMVIIEQGYGEVSRREYNTLAECYAFARDELDSEYDEVDFQIVEIVTESLTWRKRDFAARGVQYFFESYM